MIVHVLTVTNSGIPPLCIPQIYNKQSYHEHYFAFLFKQKEKNKLTEAVGTIYWLVATAIFLGWSFACESWEDSWIVWPVAGVVFAVVMTVCNLCIDKGKENQ